MIQEYHTLLTSNSIFIKRTANIGYLSAAMAIDYGCTGPVLRGSGVDYDLRRDGEERVRIKLVVAIVALHEVVERDDARSETAVVPRRRIRLPGASRSCCQPGIGCRRLRARWSQCRRTARR